MKHVVSFSGGRTSAYLVHLMEQKRIKEGLDVKYVFMDTGAEHPKTYAFIKKCVEYFGIELTVLKTVINQEMGIGPIFKISSIDTIGWDLSVFKEMTKKYGNPYNPGGGFCTDKLKTVTYNKYVKSLSCETTTWIGIRIDEQRRLKDKINVKYLAELSMMDKDDIIGWWSEMPFDLDIPEWLGNCVFCIKKGVNKVALAIKQEPELAKEWSEMTKSARALKPQTKIDAIYRGRLSIDGIAALYEDYSEQEIIDNLRRSKRATGCGSESCEVFGQMDLLEDLKD